MIKKIDHLVITTAKLNDCLDFYQKLGFTLQQNGTRYALFAGDFKINIHCKGSEIAPYAKHVQPGSADICFEITGDLAQYQEMLENRGLTIAIGPVLREGVRGQMQSIYLHDPDGNLIEFSQYMND